MAFDSETNPNQISPTDWVARTAAIRADLSNDHLPDSALIAALGSFRFRDDQQRLWSYTGATWWCWDSQQWLEIIPPATLTVEPFKFSGTSKFAQPIVGSEAAATATTEAVSDTDVTPDGGNASMDADGDADGEATEATVMDGATATEAAAIGSTVAADGDAATDAATSDGAAVSDRAGDLPIDAADASADDDSLGVDGTIPSMEIAADEDAGVPTDDTTATTLDAAAGGDLADAAVVGAAAASTPEEAAVSVPAAAPAVAAAAVMGAAAASDEPIFGEEGPSGDAGATAAAPVAMEAVAAEPVYAPVVAEPVVQPVVAQPDAQPVAAQPVAQPIAQPVAQPVAQPAVAQPAAAPTYRPTHVVPAAGMPAWPQPDPRLQPQFHLSPGLDAMVAEWLPSGWARIICSNGWSGWVDGRQLVPYGQQGYGR